MERVVLDTSVIVSALRSSIGASFKLMQMLGEGRFTMLVTASLFLEFEEVLSRSEQLSASGLDLQAVDQFLQGLAGQIEAVELYFRWRPQVIDPDDEMVAEAAINGRATCIATHNTRDFAGIYEKFNIRVVKPSELLKELKK